MCQLTFANLHNTRLNSLYLYLQWQENTDVSNRDGFGLFCNGILSKSGLSVKNINNYGDWFLTTVKSPKPVIGHVRLATATKNVKEISEETSHPFEGEKLVLAHNGVLDLKDDALYDNHKGVNVDSLIFLRELEKKYDGTNFVPAIQETMGLFQGTFAFLIYSKLEEKHFIVRGKTKKLNACKVDIKVGSKNWSGYVVNTEIAHLEKALTKLKAVGEITSGGVITIGKPSELKEETIYQAEDNDLTEVGTIKEEERKKSFFQDTTPRKNFGTTTPTQNLIGNGVISPNPLSRKNLSETAKFIADFLRINHLTIFELDYLFCLALGKPFLGVEEKEIKELITWYNDSIRDYNTEQKQELWDTLVRLYSGNPMDIYKDYEIKFPYSLNSANKLQTILEREFGVEENK